MVGLFFSLNVLYLVTCAFVMMVPEDVSGVDDATIDTHRVESAVIVNSLVLGVLGLMLAARGFSALGEAMVELLYRLIHATPAAEPAQSGAATLHKEQEVTLMGSSRLQKPISPDYSNM